MTESPLVSVIIPCHNRSSLLEQSLNTVVRQSYSNIEIIVVDDASEEDIPAVIRRMGAVPRLHYIRLGENSGPGAARETGRQAAQGQYICYLDSDDIWHEDKVARQVRAMQANPDAGMCYCVTREFSTLPITGDEPVRYLSDRHFDRFLPVLLQGNHLRPWSTPACMWARWASDRIGPWFSGWHWEDMEYECRAGCYNTPIVFVAQALCYCRKGPERLSDSDWKTSGIKKVPAILEIAQDLEKLGKTEEPEILDSLIWLLYDHGMLLLKAGERELAETCLRRLIKLCRMRHRARLFTRCAMIAPSTRLSWIIGRGLRKYLS